jgi:hypothetical protein
MENNNGLTLEKLKIVERLASMEAKFDEFKEAHNREACERQDNVVKKLDKIFEWLEALPCHEHKQDIRYVCIAIAFLFTILGYLIFGQ